MRFIIIHGSYGNAKENWFPWIKRELEKLGHEVIIPTFPTPHHQNLKVWLTTFKPYMKEVDEETVFIAHSIGCSFVLNILEEAGVKIKAAFLIAGFTGRLNNPKFDVLNKSFAEKKLDWQKIIGNCEEFVVINAKDDPYVPVEKGLELAKQLKVKPIIYEKGGHFNKDAGYTTFEDLLGMIMKIKGLDHIS